MATITRNLKLRLQDNLTADARYNLERIDQLGAIFQLDNSQSAVVRSQGVVTIIPNDPAIGGSGEPGIVRLGTIVQPIEYAEVNGPLKLLASDETNYTTIITTDIQNTQLTLNLQEADRLIQLGGDLITSGGDITFTTASDPINFKLPITNDEVDAAAAIAGSKIVPVFLSALSAPSIESGVLINGATFNLPSVDGVPNAVLTTDGAGNLSFSAVTGTGTVTSVALSLPDIFTVSGSPITDNGTLTGTLNVQAASTVLAGPASGPDAAPAFRQLTTDDITEGSNLFYTQGRFDSAFAISYPLALAASDTDDLSEGATNLYYTDLRAQDAVGNIAVDSSTIDISYTSDPVTEIASLSADVIASGLIDTNTGLAESSNILSVSPDNAALKEGANPNDAVLIADSDDGKSLKKVLLSDIVNLSGGSYVSNWTSVDGVSKTVTHGLNSKNVLVEVYDIDTGETVLLGSVVRTDDNTVTITSSQAPDPLTSGLKILIKRI